VRQQGHMCLASPSNQDLIILRELIKSDMVLTFIDRMYPLTDILEAIRHVEEVHARGKVAINVGQNS
jgi:hypothetical protein